MLEIYSESRQFCEKLLNDNKSNMKKYLVFIFGTSYNNLLKMSSVTPGRQKWLFLYAGLWP